MLHRFGGIRTYNAIALQNIRNVGIIAHIDAGKTTTTERMLYYVGYTSSIGNVDSGSTVTDYLKTERERGITIQSACIPFAWRKHRINLIDTPGHVDFTIEVERSLRVLDGVVTIIDGVAGVEAQTETVWRQANFYKIPRIIYINKMDRDGASFEKSILAIKDRLLHWGIPLICQIPVFSDGTRYASKESPNSKFVGVIDIISLKQLDWSKDPKGAIVDILDSIVDPDLSDEAQKARVELIERLGDIDDAIVETFIKYDGEHLKIPSGDVRDSVRRCTINGTAVPILCGSSFKNIGVQPVLDAIIDYLPAPSEAPVPLATSDTGIIPISVKDTELCALAFKVVYDAQRGLLVFVRVYSGTLKARSILQISRSNNKSKSHGIEKERATKLLEMYADDFEEVSEIQAGNVGVIVGLKKVKTGDTLVSSHDLRGIKLHDIIIPQPVFVRSVHVESSSEESELSIALNNLLLEDPSLTLTSNEETGQTLLSGMGELHLEIAGERLLDTYKIKAKLGKVEISYRETIGILRGTQNLEYDRDFFGKLLKCDIELEIIKIEEDNVEIDCQIDLFAIFRGGTDVMQEVGGIYPPLEEIQSAIYDGINSGVSRGPMLGFPVSQIRVVCKRLSLYSPALSTLPAIKAATHACTQKILHASGSRLLEPIMKMEIRVPTTHVGRITRDLSGPRQGIVHSIESKQDRSYIFCSSPLSQLLGYASTLRGLTQGTGEWIMELQGYSPVVKSKEEFTVKQIRGY